MGSDAAISPPHMVQVDKCEDKDEVHEVNIEVKVSDIFEEGIGKIFAHIAYTAELLSL